MASGKRLLEGVCWDQEASCRYPPQTPLIPLALAFYSRSQARPSGFRRSMPSSAGVELLESFPVPSSKTWPLAVAAPVRHSLVPSVVCFDRLRHPPNALRSPVALPNPRGSAVSSEPPSANLPLPPSPKRRSRKVQNPLKARRLQMQMRWYHDFHYNSVEQDG